MNGLIARLTLALALIAVVSGCGRAAAPAALGKSDLGSAQGVGLPVVGDALSALVPLLQAPDRAARNRLIKARRRAKHAELRRLSRSRSVRAALRHAYLADAITREAYDADRRALKAATAAANGLSGVRGAEMRAALGIVQSLARDHVLRADRLAAAFIQLRRNTTWWLRRGPPPYGKPLVQGRDPVTMKYIPGQGLVVHYLSSWGRVNALARDCSTKPEKCPRKRLRRAVDRMLSLGSMRHGFLTWESLFAYGGGRAGWVSAITQGTALQALARSASVLQSRRLERLGRRTLGAFEHPPPVGLSVPAKGGRHYLMYSFAPNLRILNGFLRAVTGLRDFSRLAGSHRAFLLYKAGAGAARREIDRDDTGAWSRYSDGGDEASFGYHRLAAGFLADLCAIAHRRDFCSDAARFAAYLTQPPRMRLRASRLPRAGSRASVVIALSKVSTLNFVVSDKQGPVLARRLTMTRGVRTIRFRAPRRGRYKVTVVAQGPSGPLGRATTGLHVVRSAADAKRARDRRRKSS